MTKYSKLYFDFLKNANTDGMNLLNPIPSIASAMVTPARQARKKFNDFVDSVKSAPHKYPQSLPAKEVNLVRPKPITMPKELPEPGNIEDYIATSMKPSKIEFK